MKKQIRVLKRMIDQLTSSDMTCSEAFKIPFLTRNARRRASSLKRETLKHLVKPQDPSAPMSKSDEEVAQEESAALLAEQAEQAEEQEAKGMDEEAAGPPEIAEIAEGQGDQDGDGILDCDDGDYLKADLGITMEEVVQSRKDMLSNIGSYMQKGSYNKASLMQKRFSRPKSNEDMKLQAFNRSKLMAKRRAQQAVGLAGEADDLARIREEEELDEMAKYGGLGPSGAPLTDEEKKAQQLEKMRSRKEKAARRRSRSRSESKESDLAVSPGATGGGNGGRGCLSDEDSDEIAPPKVLTAEERKAKELNDMRVRKDKSTKRRARSRADEAAKSGGAPATNGLDDPDEDAENGSSTVSGAYDDDDYDDEDLMSPASRSKKPIAKPGCAVHSVGGKFVQVPIFGKSPGRSTVPTANARRKAKEAAKK